jgi:hypothetical protein
MCLKETQVYTLNQNLNTHPKSPVTMPCLLQKRQNVRGK